MWSRASKAVTAGFSTLRLAAARPTHLQGKRLQRCHNVLEAGIHLGVGDEAGGQQVAVAGAVPVPAGHAPQVGAPQPRCVAVAVAAAAAAAGVLPAMPALPVMPRCGCCRCGLVPVPHVVVRGARQLPPLPPLQLPGRHAKICWCRCGTSVLVGGNQGSAVAAAQHGTRVLVYVAAQGAGPGPSDRQLPAHLGTGGAAPPPGGHTGRAARPAAVRRPHLHQARKMASGGG